MGRKANDGRGRLGGRQPGVGNKDKKPLRDAIRTRSEDYFCNPCIPVYDDNGNPTGEFITRCEEDMNNLDPATRLNAQIQLAKFHTPQMASTNVDLNVRSNNRELSERLALLAAGKEIAPEEDE